MKKLIALAAILISVAFGSAAEAKPFEIFGQMQYADGLEGGCWYLESEDGERYQLVATPDEMKLLQVKGRRVRLRVEDADQMASTCMMGRIVRVMKIMDGASYPVDMAWTYLTLKGRVYKSKGGCYYLKTRNANYELSPANMPAKFKKRGARFYQEVKVMMGKGATKCGFDGLIFFERPQTKAKEKRPADPR
jgi:hypothetical protein